jgi:hypothetical protein
MFGDVNPFIRQGACQSNAHAIAILRWLRDPAFLFICFVPFIHPGSLAIIRRRCRVDVESVSLAVVCVRRSWLLS